MLSASGAWALPECPQTPNAYWSNCVGTYTFANGEKYVGEYKDDKRNGQGTYTWPNGEVYVGENKDDKRNGQGTYTWPNGQKYVGENKDDKRNGQGTNTWPNGKKYVGEWLDDKANGQGVLTLANGTVQEGVFKNGVFQYAQKTPYSSNPSFLQVAFNDLSQFQRKQSIFASKLDD